MHRIIARTNQFAFKSLIRPTMKARTTKYNFSNIANDINQSLIITNSCAQVFYRIVNTKFCFSLFKNAIVYLYRESNNCKTLRKTKI